MGSQYASSYPEGVTFSPQYKDFFQHFYQISDTPDAHEQYSQQFTKDATLVMASKTAKGQEEILNLRKGMWEKVSSRSHHPIKVFPFGPNSHECMLYGTVDYRLKAGGTASVPWAARAVLTMEGADKVVRFKEYQVYLDTAAQAAQK